MGRIRHFPYKEFMVDNDGVKNLNEFANSIADKGVRDFW